MLAVITDRKRAGNTSGADILWYDADVVSAQQYYPFGMLMPDTTSTNLRRQYSNPNCFDKDYRYGFNGKEGDDEVKGDDNQIDYGARLYDPRIGRWLSVDPLTDFAPAWTPYRYGFDNPILYTDPLGLFEDKAAAKDYAKAHSIKTGWFRNNKIVENSDGTWSIENKKAHTSISDLGGDIGVMTSALVTGRGVHLRDIGMDGYNELSDPSFDSYNPNAKVLTDGVDIAYALGSYLGLASPSGRLIKVGRASGSAIETGISAVKGVENVAVNGGNLVKIGAIEDDVMIFSAKVGNETLEGISNFVVKDGKLYLNQLHVQGSKAGKIGRESLWNIAKDLGRQYNVNEVVLQGGRRTTGKYKGEVPSPITIKID